MELIQIILIIAGAVLIYITRKFYLINKLKRETYLIFLLIGFMLIITSVFPQVSVILSNLVGINRGTDLFVYISIIVIFYLIISINIRIETLEQKFSALIEQLALNNPETKNHDNSKKKIKRKQETENKHRK